jgi:hypothetical protein
LSKGGIWELSMICGSVVCSLFSTWGTCTCDRSMRSMMRQKPLRWNSRPCFHLSRIQSFGWWSAWYFAIPLILNPS